MLAWSLPHTRPQIGPSGEEAASGLLLRRHLPGHMLPRQAPSACALSPFECGRLCIWTSHDGRCSMRCMQVREELFQAWEIRMQHLPQKTVGGVSKRV